jgi:hypothetical protein
MTGTHPGHRLQMAESSMRMQRLFLGYLLLAAATGGCAAWFQGERESPERVAERGLEALTRGDYDAGIADLRWVSTYHPERGIARYTLLVLAAAKVDPANPDRQLDAGSDRLSELRALPENPNWITPVAGSLHRLILELQLERERAEQAERSARAARERATAATREVGAAQNEREALRGRVAQLERELQASRQQVAAARQEVARMRRALDG